MAAARDAIAREVALTHAPRGHLLANRGCWSEDSQSLLFDLRADETRFDSPSIDRVGVDSGRQETVYRAGPGLACGVPTCCPIDDRFVFIHQDPPPGDDWPYCAWHRHGVIGHSRGEVRPRVLDARDLVPPYTSGALRGGTHLHTFHPNGRLLVSTYEDHVLATTSDPAAQANRRGLAVHLLDHPVSVPPFHPRNQSGVSFSFCATRLADVPAAGSDEISSATGEAWVGGSGEIAFQGAVRDAKGGTHFELFLVTLPTELLGGGTGLDGQLRVADHPLAGTPTSRPGVPAGVSQRRLTNTTDRPFPGIHGPRHWAVASPDGSRIGCYLPDDHGLAQFWTVSTANGQLTQVTRCPFEPTSCFTWHPDGSAVAYVADGSLFWIEIDTGTARRLTPRSEGTVGPTHHACVFSPDGRAIAFLRPAPFGRLGSFPQIHLVTGW